MRITCRQEFLALPAGTVYSEGRRWVFGSLAVKLDSRGANDWLYDSLDGLAIQSKSSDDRIDSLEAAAADSSVSLPMDFAYTGRDGCYDQENLYAVFEPHDVKALIARLLECL